MKNLRILLLGVSIFGLLVAACQPTPTAAPVEAAPPSPSAPPASLPSATYTPPPAPTLTRAPTRTPQPTPTDRPKPSATPQGYYQHNEAGFRVAFPQPIQVQSADKYWVNFLADESKLYFSGAGFPYDPEINLDLMIEYIFEGSQIVYRSDPLEVLLGPRQLPGVVVDIGFVVSPGDRLDAQVIYYEDGRRFYFFNIYGERGFAGKYRQLLESVYASIDFFTPSLFNLPSDQTLNLLGADPNPEDLDPQVTTGSASGYVGLLFAGLVRLDGNMNVVPDLAEDWSISADGTVYTFTLRADLSFADGYYLTTDDVIYSWNRAADPATNSPTYQTYLGDIVGVEEVHASRAQSISGLKALSARVLQVTLDAPKPYFLLKLTYPVAFVIDRTDVEKGGKDWMYDPNSSGPYVIDQYEEMEKLVFRLNRRYHTPPAIPYVGYLLNPAGSPISRYEDGSLDLLSVYGETALRARRVEDTLHADLRSVPSLCTSYIAMNNTLPPFDDPLVRQAFLLAFDRDTYMQRLNRGLDITALSLLPPAMPGHLGENAVPLYDPAAARAALAASRYAGALPEVILETDGFGGAEDDVVNALADMWRRTLGIDIRVVFLDPINFTEAARQYPAHLTAAGWCAARCLQRPAAWP